MKTMMLQNKPVFIALAVALVILLAVYFKGRSDGSQPGFFSKLFGLDSEPVGNNGGVIRNIYVPEPGDSSSNNWRPNAITDRIYKAIEDHWSFKPNGTEINNAFETFNALTHNQKIAVVNDWEQRYKATDKAGWFTGDYGSLKEVLNQWIGDFQPQVEIAWTWMNNNQID